MCNENEMIKMMIWNVIINNNNEKCVNNNNNE